jgi:hypothetical protein
MLSSVRSTCSIYPVQPVIISSLYAVLIGFPTWRKAQIIKAWSYFAEDPDTGMF